MYVYYTVIMNLILFVIWTIPNQAVCCLSNLISEKLVPIQLKVSLEINYEELIKHLCWYYNMENNFGISKINLLFGDKYVTSTWGE